MAHGGNPNIIDENTFREICIMYNDGLIGNMGILEVLGNLTAGVYNYMRSTGQSPYRLQDIIKRSYKYLFPQDNTTDPSDTLLLFLSQAPDFKMDRFKNVN